MHVALLSVTLFYIVNERNALYISSDKQLKEFVKRALEQELLAMDTEFLREKTYYARLCLLQLATPEEAVIVDPFKISDMSILAPLMKCPSVVKVLHAGRQDVEILYRELGCMPEPIFDTQIAAAVLGHTQQMGYGALVSSECGVSLKKGDSYTDWSRRPLTDSQQRYALDDVLYLPQMYYQMTEKLEQLGRTHWLDEDFNDLINPEKYKVDPYERFVKLKRCSTLSRKQLSAAREVAAWRELRARKLDIPRKWVLSDEQIVEACRKEARTIDALFMVRGIKEKLGTRDGREVAELMCKGLDAPKESWPELSRKSRNENNVDDIVDVMGGLLRLRAQENDIAFQTLASRDDLTALARGHYEDTHLTKGWRKGIVGNELMALLEGKLAITVEDGKLKVNTL